MKRKLLLAALCVVGALGMRAQTDVTSTYITNASFDSGSAFAQKKANSVSSSITGWTVSEGGNYQYYTVGNSGSNEPDNDSGFGKTVTAANGTKYVHIRHGWKGSSTEISQSLSNLPKGKFTLSLKHKGATPQSKSPTLKLSATPSGSSAIEASYNSYPTSLTRDNNTWTWDNNYGDWSVLSCEFELSEAKNTTIKIKFTDSNMQNSSNDEVIYDDVRLTYKNVNGSQLALLIVQATAINDKIGTLTSEIVTAQGVYNGINNTPAYQETIDNAISTLQSAISTKLAAYTGLNAAGDDITSFILNNGFETSPTFDGTSTGSGSAPKSNATPTAGSTLLYNAKNVYQVYGWELMTTETSDYARTFTMPYNNTLYVQSNNAVAGQAVAAPTNGSSVTTDNNNLLFVEANWCQNAVLGVKQTITLPAGSYRLTFDSYVTTSIGNANSRCGVSYGETTNYKWPVATNTWTANEVDFTLDEPKDVTISMGYKKINNVGGGESAFLFVDNVKLTYFDPLKLAQIQWQEAWDALDALDETALPDAAETAITDALGASEPNDVEAYNTAKAALQALIDSYDGIKEAYDKVLALITFATAEKDNSTGDKTTFATAISTATTNIETRTAANDLTSDYNTLETARQTFVTSGAQPTSGHVFDYTFKIPDAAVTSATDWTNKRTASGQQYTGAPDNTYFDNYNENRNIQKNIGTLRLGKYELKVATRSDASVTIGNVYVSQNNANLSQTDIHHDGNTGGDLGNGWSWTTVAFDNYKNDKDITLGFYSECGSSKWAGADDFHLYYKGNVVDDEKATALKATVVTENINATVASEQTTALNNFISTQTFENYNTLKSAIDAAKESKTVYEKLDAALTNVEGWTTNVTSVTDPMRLKYNNGTYSDETTDNDIYEEYQAAEITALVAASASNWTSAIINASFETGDNTGWTATKRTDTGVKSTNDANYAITSGDITSGSYMFNSWGSTNENDVQQTIKNLPAGTYTLAAVLAGFNDESLVIAANSETGNTVVAGDKTVGYLTFVTFTLDAAADVVIKASNTKSAGSSDYSFIKADNFQLYVGTGVPASAYKPNLLYAINNATNARNSANEGTGVFQIPTAAGTTLATDIATAQAVYDNASATLEQINQAITDVDAARTTYKGTELNAPANDKRYCIKVATSEHAKLNNAVVVNLGSTGVNNPTGYTFNASAAPASYLAQAFTFTQVTGNTYKISIEMPAGTVYLTNGTKNGSNAGWKAAQIQGATDADNAMEFTIEAGDVANTFYIYNSETNSTIACQDAGNLYTQSGNAYFAVEEVSQASATMSIKADKWGTFIAPFAVDLPKNVKAYTVTGVAAENEINYMVKEEVTTTIPANTPVVLKNNTGANVSEVFNGWGTAPAVNKTVGLLTGHYDSDYDIPDGSYILQTQSGTQAFYLVSPTMSGKGVANRCYLTLPANNNANKRNALFFDKEEGTTGLEAPGATSTDDGILYNVAGQQVNASYKGLIIKNRRVMLNK